MNEKEYYEDDRPRDLTEYTNMTVDELDEEIRKCETELKKSRTQ